MLLETIVTMWIGLLRKGPMRWCETNLMVGGRNWKYRNSKVLLKKKVVNINFLKHLLLFCLSVSLNCIHCPEFVG